MCSFTALSPFRLFLLSLTETWGNIEDNRSSIRLSSSFRIQMSFFLNVNVHYLRLMSVVGSWNLRLEDSAVEDGKIRFELNVVPYS